MTSIRGRLVLSLVAGLAVVLALGGGAVHGVVKSALLEQLDSEALARAEGLASQVTFDDGVVEFEFAKGEAPDEIEDGFFEFRRRNGDLLWRSEGLEGIDLPIRALSGVDESAIEDVDLQGIEEVGVVRCAWLLFEPRVDPDLDANEDAVEDADEEPQELPEGAVRLTEFEPLIVAVAIDRTETDEAIAVVRNSLFAVGAMIAGMGGLLVYVGVRWGLRPLDRLARQLERVDESSLDSPPDGAGAPMELAPVYRELGRMLGRIEATLARERLFSSAAAHELRTPLAEIRATAEVARKWPDDARGMAALDEILAVCTELEALVENLLLISRASIGGAGGRTDSGALRRIIDGQVDHAMEEISQRGLEVRVEIPTSAALEAPPEAIDVIARNLIDNAVRYTPAGGRIVVRASGGENGDGAFVVANSAPSLSETDLPHLFDAFWQADSARSDRRHVGLGLTVVRQVAAAAGMRVDAGLADGTLTIGLRRAHTAQGGE